MAALLIPIAISSQLDESGEERIHAANGVLVSAIKRPLLPVVITGELPDGTVGEDVEGTYTGHGGIPPYSFYVNSGNLPDGVVLNSDGTYLGTFEGAGEFSWEIGVVDSTEATALHEDSNSVTPA